MEKEEFQSVQALKGGIGCDLVTGTGLFKARLGAIYGVQSNANSSRIGLIREIIKNAGAASDTRDLTGASGRSYISTNTTATGGNSIDNGKWVIFDNPVSHIQPIAGSFWVFYQNI